MPISVFPFLFDCRLLGYKESIGEVRVGGHHFSHQKTVELDLSSSTVPINKDSPFKSPQVCLTQGHREVATWHACYNLSYESPG